MLTRRSFTAAAMALVALTSANAAWAQGWQEDYPEIVFAVIPAENASTTTNRYTPMAEYLSEELGVEVTLRIANDYAAVIEGQRAGNIQMAMYGPASFARSIMTGVEVEPLVIPRHGNNATGYYSVIYVRADSPYQSLADLEGKSLALVDPNSTSGNNAPRYFLNREGYDVETFFGRNFYAGSHENAVLALAQGTADAAANAWTSEQDSYLTRMISRGMVKDASGNTLSRDDFRILYTSDLLVEGPYSVLSSMPEEARNQIRQALLDMPTKNKAAFDALSDGEDLEFVSVSTQDFDPIVEMLKFNDTARKS